MGAAVRTLAAILMCKHPSRQPACNRLFRHLEDYKVAPFGRIVSKRDRRARPLDTQSGLNRSNLLAKVAR